MTEVASLHPANHRLTSVRQYEAGPPPELALVEPGQSIALTKEEEWISKKKTEVVNTKQIETRVKRQVVLEDGKVVEDSGPMVTTNTTEDTETQEHHQTELRKLGDDEIDGPLAVEGNQDNAVSKRNWVVTANPDGVVREVNEKRVLTREETDEVKETEDIQHFGDITDEDFLAAVRSGHSDIRKVLRVNEGGQAVVSTGPRVVHESIKSKKVIDTEEKKDLSSVQADGKIVTESQRTTEHEEIKDEELPEDAVVEDSHKESTERHLKTRDQVDVDYLADGVTIGHEMRFKTENVEVERKGDGLDEPDFDSLSARLRRRTQNRPPHRYRGVENPNPNANPLDRKDALTGQPLDFEREEQTRKVETSKWLEHHFGSDSKSSSNSLIDEEEEPPKTSFFNVTIKSQPSRTAEPEYLHRNYSSPMRTSPRVYSPPMEPERDGNPRYFKGITEWSERRQENHFSSSERRSPFYQERSSPPERLPQHSPTPDYRDNVENFRGSRDNLREVREHHRPEYRDNYREEKSYQTREPPREYRTNYRENEYREYKEPLKDYNWDYRRENGVGHNGTHRENGHRVHREEEYRETRENHRVHRGDYSSMDRRDLRSRSPDVTPIPPHRKRGSERRQRIEEEKRYQNGYRRSPPVQLDEPLEEPPPDYSPPSPPPMPREEKKVVQKTRFAADPPKAKSGNIIGQSIRKLVGKIRSASAERKARQRAKRSPSPSYQPGHIIDGNIHGSMENGRPVQRYYLGEDPFAGSIYGRENKYDGVRPARVARRKDEPRSQSTLGRFSKSTGKLTSTLPNDRKSSQTLPRHMSRHQSPPKLEKNNKSNSTINVSIINTVRPQNEGPAKPARTYKANLSRSKSFNINSEEFNGRDMYKSNPHLRLNDSSTGLKSPGLISSLSRSQRDINEESYSRFRNGAVDNQRVFLKSLKERSPELYKTLHENEDPYNRTPPKSGKVYNGDIYEPPTRLRDTYVVSSTPIKSLRSGSNSSDYSETYRTTTRSDDPLRPSVTNTTKTVSKKTVPSKDGRSFETIESSEVKSITKSSYRGDPKIQYRDTERRYTPSPVVIEVRNNYRK
ncbi:serine/arginine repetitive matrix protein 1 isoform X2 [Harmonia axyridis]|uniref:serine/arginine repetitive matrix protein 1 isoform X2 n=1 Tax=Harmonia axyridis TaxID=115357 RepID=UPI001E27721C|nr:serine/arginine repetitive matrix protein 1 isoform X2 [Harmonia axyridis]XP_045477495.1 serine/arginine repetitive matrix protein 1 isoform X2 [Harmonia axyridis]